MSAFKLNVVMYATVALLGATLVGCVADVSDEEMASEDPAAGEDLGEAQQALDTCTPYGSGGGTWGDILKLCVTPQKYLYVMKRDGSAFSSSGVMELKHWLGTMMSVNVYANTNTRKVHFGPHLPGDYGAVFNSNNGGVAHTGWLYVQ